MGAGVGPRRGVQARLPLMPGRGVPSFGRGVPERPDDDVPEAALRAKRAVAETARHVAPHWPKLHKAEKRCRKAYMRAFKAHLALAAAQPTPQGGGEMDLEPPGFGWSMPAFNSIPMSDGGGGGV